MSNTWDLPQETQDQIRQDFNIQLELAPREFPEDPVVDTPELSLRDLPEPPPESSQPPIIDLEGWDEHLPLTQEQRAMNMDEPSCNRNQHLWSMLWKKEGLGSVPISHDNHPTLRSHMVEQLMKKSNKGLK